MSAPEFISLPLQEQVDLLYRQGSFIVAIRYYGYKVNLYLINGFYVEVFYNHKLDKIERIELLPNSHTRLKFYSDQISLPQDLLN
ncbi:MAG: hypothetical protein AAF944_01965 [Bacteroidota bacterium]